MKTGRFLSPFLFVLASCALLFGCAGSVRPTTPPTFVMTWTADPSFGGPSGQVWTIESNDGIVWKNPSPQNLQGNQSESAAGPAIAHDGNLTWMLMWPNPRGLDFKLGTGGVALSGEGGVVWESQPHQGLLPVSTLGFRPNGSPALAFGNDRWVAVFRTVGTGDRLRVVRSQPNSATSWESARDITVQTAAGVRNISSPRDPALVFGQRTFVLIHRRQTGFNSTTSPDGVIWTDRGPIAPFQFPQAEEISDPAVTFSNGNFYAALRRRFFPLPPGWSDPPSRIEIYKSADGISWTRITDEAGYFRVGETFGPGFSFGDFGNNVCKAILTNRGVQKLPNGVFTTGGIQSWTGTPPPPHTCTDPSLLVFSPPDDAGVEVTPASTASRTSVAFGQTLP